MDSIVEDAIDEAEESPVDDSGGRRRRERRNRRSPASDRNDDRRRAAGRPPDLQTNITVVGCGGAGGNTVNRMTEEGIHGATNGITKKQLVDWSSL